jgi:branched-chain amino acid transport system substrate-binding protein
MKRRLLYAIAWAIVTTVLSPAAYSQTPVKLGVLTPLSPPGDATAGQMFLRGARIATDEVNAGGGILGGRKLELVIEDDSGTPEKGVAGFRKLATQDRVVAVVGQYHSSVMQAAQVLAEQYKIPFFASQATAAAITEKHLTYTFRTCIIDADRARMWTGWIKERAFKRVTLITENTDYGIGLSEETKKFFGAMVPGAELKTVIYDRSVVDLTPQMLEIKNWKPDLVINGGVGTPAYLIMKQAYDVGLFPAVPMLINYDLPVRPEYAKNLGDKGNWASFMVYYHPGMKLTQRGAAFRRKYMEQFKEEVVYTAFQAYTQVMLVTDAVNAAKSEKGEELVKALLGNKFEGWNGTISFSRGEGPYWQQWAPPILVTQLTRLDMPFSEMKIIFPPEFRTGEWVPGPKR